MDKKDIIRKYVLQNAILHDGKAQAGAIVGKLIAENPKNKSKIKDLMPEIYQLVEKINKLSLETQRKQLENIAPELLEKKKVEEIRQLPPLENAREGKVVTRYPPEPSGYPHMGHAISFWFNRMYADQYKGKVWLRFEDTNPLKAKKEYYQAIKQALKWLGLDYELEKNVSDDIPKFYEYAGKLLKKGTLYVCTCLPEMIKLKRSKGEECPCRSRSIEENIMRWYRMLTKTAEGRAIVRLKGDMKSPNMDLRDPTMFRIIDYPHVLQGKKYRVWPTYDFAGSIEDSICGITHVLRSAEFEQRAILQGIIRKALGFKDPQMIHYSRFGLEGAPTSKRKIRQLIESKIVSGWDDPRLATIKGLKRRGILPQTFKELALMIGPSKSRPNIEWKLLLSVNKKFLDPIANRYFLVREPIKLKIKGAAKKTAQLSNHPEFPERGKRKISTNGEFFIEKSDVMKMKLGDCVRLKDLYNFRVRKINKDFVEGEFDGTEMSHDSAKIHWVSPDFIKVKVIVPGILLINDKQNPESWREFTAYGEKSMNTLKQGDQIQMERFGFARVDCIDPLIFVFTSK